MDRGVPPPPRPNLYREGCYPNLQIKIFFNCNLVSLALSPDHLICLYATGSKISFGFMDIRAQIGKEHTNFCSLTEREF